MRTLQLLVVMAFLMYGCSPRSSAPVIELSPKRNIPQFHVVRSGDTLYSIAWENGLDYQTIASWNNIRKPFLIKVGQKIKLGSSSNQSASNQTTSKSTSQTSTVSTTQTNTQSTSQVSTSNPSKWNWPATGTLIGQFSRDKGVNGIQIAGKDGSHINSTAAGQVVYAGEGLRGYGKLIIVKHSASFLSAYAHNRQILVSEGEKIASGQKIALMGSSGTNKTMLHFEIRVDGKPVDPMKYLK